MSASGHNSQRLLRPAGPDRQVNKCSESFGKHNRQNRLVPPVGAKKRSFGSLFSCRENENNRIYSDKKSKINNLLRQAGPAFRFFAAEAASRFSHTRKRVIRSINASGMGRSSGNCTEPFPCLYAASSAANSRCPVGVA